MARNGPRSDGARADGATRRELPLVADRMVGLDRQIASGHPAVAAGWDLPVDLDKDAAVIPQLADVEVPEDLKREIEWRMSLYPDPRSAVIPALKAAQSLHGWLSTEAMRQVAAVMKVTPAYLSSIASFYDMLNEEPLGSRYIYVCTSVSCHLVNAKAVYDAIVEAAREASLEDWDIREFECLGACDMQPMASIDGRYVGPLDPSDAPEIVAAITEGRTPLPGRGLDDEEYMPAGVGDPPPQEEAG
jgi:NADH-quinone oxidoreductase subunit E